MVFVLAPCNGLYIVEQLGQRNLLFGSSTPTTQQGEIQTDMSSCPYGIAFSVQGKPVALWCGKWSCERCQKINAKLWAWRASLHINNSDRTAYHWTLTLRSTVKTPYQGFKAIPTLWDNLRKIVQRKSGKWSYMAFVECHPQRSKIPHFHVLSLTPSPLVGTHKTQAIKDLAFTAGFGYIASESEVQGYKAAYYVAKYASKHDPAMPRNFRRVRVSQDWTKLPEVELDPYIVQSPTESLTDYLLRVNTQTCVDVDVLYMRWADAQDEYMIKQS